MSTLLVRMRHDPEFIVFTKQIYGELIGLSDLKVVFELLGDLT